MEDRAYVDSIRRNISADILEADVVSPSSGIRSPYQACQALLAGCQAEVDYHVAHHSSRADDDR